MPTLQIKLTENVSPTVAAMIADMRNKGAITAASAGVQNELKDFYAGLEQTRPNKMGYPRQHFWADVRGTVQRPEVTTPQTASVSITHLAIRQRIEGGYIRPGPGKDYLTLPANEKAYGHRAREFSFLRFGFAENRYGHLAPALIATERSDLSFGRKRKDGTKKITGTPRGEEVFYWLVKQVYQPADPGALPATAQLVAAAVRGANEWAADMQARAQAKLNQPPEAAS
jgi:hypothetical protein